MLVHLELVLVNLGFRVLIFSLSVFLIRLFEYPLFIRTLVRVLEASMKS